MMNKTSKETTETFKDSPVYSMEELESLKENEKEEEEMIDITRIPEVPEKKTPSLGWFFGYIAGILTVVIACGLSYKKKWDRV